MKMSTEKLYYQDSFLHSFSAKVLSCEPQGKSWSVVLDRTAFYPEGGGQPADRGTLTLPDGTVLRKIWEKKRHPVLISGHWIARNFRFRMRNTTGLLQIMFCSMSRICPAVCRKSAVCFQMTACSTAVRMEKAI